MKKFYAILFALSMVTALFVSCGTDTAANNREPGSFVDLDVKSRLAKKSWKFLENYLSEKAPQVRNLVLVSAQSQVVEGKNLILVAEYQTGAQKFFLRAEMYQNPKGDLRVNKVVYTYDYDFRKGE